MSQHPSLRSKTKEAVHRSVLKRYERLKALKEKEKWDQEESVYGLPKLKIIKFKIKKEKAVAAEAVEGAVGATGEAQPAESAPKGAAGKEAAVVPKKDTAKTEVKAKPEGKAKETKR